jgi:hypothetical protein
LSDILKDCAKRECQNDRNWHDSAISSPEG